MNLDIHRDCRVTAVTKGDGSRIAGESVGDAWDTLLPPVNNWTLPPPPPSSTGDLCTYTYIRIATRYILPLYLLEHLRRYMGSCRRKITAYPTARDTPVNVWYLPFFLEKKIDSLEREKVLILVLKFSTLYSIINLFRSNSEETN